MAGLLIRLFSLLAMPLVATGVWAQSTVADPTRPPGSLADPSLTAEATGPVLQSVLMPKKGKPVAVIGGQQVRLGEKYGESRLVRLSEREAVLDGPSGIERLSLTPGIEKINIKKSHADKTTATQGVQRGSKP